MEEKIKEVLAKEGFVEKLLACEEPEQVQALFSAEGIELTLDQVKQIGAGLNASLAEGDELDEDALDSVAGGVAISAIVGGIITGIEVIAKVPWRRVGRAIKNFFRRW